MKLYAKLASLVVAIQNCEKSGNAEWKERHTEKLEALVKEHMPSGSGFDAGTRLDVLESSSNRLVFVTSYHHMNEAGMYDGWTDHAVIVKANLAFGFRLIVGGRDRKGFKDYCADVFHTALQTDIAE